MRMRLAGGRRALARSPRLLLLPALLVSCSLVDDLDDLSAAPAVASANGGGSGSEQGGPFPGGDAGPSGGQAGAGAAGEGGGTAGDGSGGAAGSSAAGATGSSAGAGGSGSSGALGASRVFWLERGSKTVHVATSEGAQNQTLYTVTGGASAGLSGIAIDPVGSRVYFADEKRNRIQSMNFDGSGLLTPLSGLSAPAGVDLDTAGGKLYFSERGSSPRIQRANLDGTAPEPLLNALGAPSGLAVDAVAGKLYFVDATLGAVLSAHLDGSELTNLNIDGVTDPVEISVDTLDGKLYWSELAASGPRIRRANLDGSLVEDIITTLTLPGFSTAAGLEVDVAGRALYFIDGGTNGSILRTNLDGTGTVPVLGGLDDPTSLALSGP